MKIFNGLFVLFLSFLMLACDTTSENNGVVLDDTKVFLSYHDQKGQNLLNPEHDHAFTKQNIDIYYVKNGKKERVFDGNLHHPKNFDIFRQDSTYPYVMHLFCNPNFEKGFATTYIQLPTGVIDTLVMKGEYHEGADRWHGSDVWLNGKLKWSIDSLQKPDFRRVDRTVSIH